MNADQELLAVFKAEVAEQIEELDRHMAGSPGDWDVATLFRLSHNVKGAARMVDASYIQQSSHVLEDLFSAMRSGTVETRKDVIVLARQGVRLMEKCFADMDKDFSTEIGQYRKAVGAILAPSSASAPAKPVEDVTEFVAAVSASEAAAADSDAIVEMLPRDAASETLRVSVEKLDKLMEIATEFLTTAHRIQEFGQLIGRMMTDVSELQIRSGQMFRGSETWEDIVQTGRTLRQGLVQEGGRNEQLSGRFQDAIRMLRMVRVDTVNSLLSRVIRDACETTGHDAELALDGGDVEIDRAVIASLRDPLIHLARNSVAHGIESPADRMLAGKPAKGSVHLVARSVGAWVELAVEDDGRGIDLARLRRAAVRKGIVQEDQAGELTDAQVKELIFHRGFSTTEQTDSLSGRGVGLDVVRENVLKLGGTVEVDPRPGRGARFVLRVPLTRLTTKGIVARIGRQLYTIPVMSVERTKLVSRNDMAMMDGQEVVPVDGRLIPIATLESLLQVPADAQPRRPAILLAEGGRRRAILVDEVLGEKEFVIQRLSWNLEHVPYIAGGAVLNGAQIVFVLDSGEIVGGRASSTAASAWSESRTEIRQRRILIVDDSVTSRTLEKNILGAAGYDITLAVDGEEAWKRLAAESFDLVISDVEMPRMDGITLTRNIRAEPRLQTLPVVLVTSLGNEEHKQRGAQAGANAYIVKGAFDQDQLLKAVARLL